MSKHHKHKYSRRDFLGTASCAAIGSTTLFSTLFNLQSLSASSLYNSQVLGAGEDYKALVCIMLGGGNDGYNMLVPMSTPHYNEYTSTRSNQALAKDSLLELSPNNYSQKTLGLHPSMSEIKTLFDQEKLALVCNVGTLVGPTSKAQYENGNNLPFGLFSHSDQDQQWQTSVPQTSSPTGWAGRLADLVKTANENQNISMNISLAGKNVFQLGNESSEYSILATGTGSKGIVGYGSSANTFDQIRTSAVNSLMEKQYQDLFKKTYANVIEGSQNTHELFSKAVVNSSIATPFESLVER